MIDELRSALVDAIAAEHRLRRQAVREGRDEAMWRRREGLARDRGLAEMSAGARTRADRHARMQQILLTRADEIHTEIEVMRGGHESTRWVGRAPPMDDLEARLTALEIEDELEAIRASVGERASGTERDTMQA